MSFLYVIIHYTTQLLICQYPFANSFLRFRRNTSKSPIYAIGKRSCLLRLRHRLIVRGSSGIAPLATALDAKYAGCHTPRRPRPQWFDLLSIGWEWLAVPPLVHRHCGRSVAPLPSSLQVYYTTKGMICQYLFQIFF